MTISFAETRPRRVSFCQDKSTLYQRSAYSFIKKQGIEQEGRLIDISRSLLCNLNLCLSNHWPLQYWY